MCTVKVEIAGVVLASGLSRRFGFRNKLLLPFGNATVAASTVGAYVGAGLAPVLVVCGHDAERVRHALRDMNVSFVDNPDFREGQSRSLVRGVSTLDEDVAAAIIGVADQPLLRSAILEELATVWRQSGARIVAPLYAGVRGNPVLFDRALFTELTRTIGDTGGRAVMKSHEREIEWIPVPDAGAGADIDTPADYERLVRLAG